MVFHRGVGRILRLIMALGLFGLMSSTWAATLILVATKINDSSIEPTGFVTVHPGDQIEAEVHVRDWSEELPTGITGYRTSVLAPIGAGFSGSVLPHGWPVEACTTGECFSDNGCEVPNDCCFGCCMTAQPLAISTDTSRADFLFHGCESTVDATPDCGEAQVTAALVNCDPIQDLGTERYLATLRLAVSDDACGVFVFSFGQGPLSTLTGQVPEKIKIPSARRNLRVLVPECGPNLIMSDPEDCLIDPGAPPCWTGVCTREVNSQFHLTFDGPMNWVRTSDFEVSLVPIEIGEALPQVAIAQASDSQVLVGLSRRFQPGRWTCLEYLIGGQQTCLGILLGDVNQDGLAEPADLELLVDNLLGAVVPTLELIQCDLDRSGICAPGDILMGADMLAGSDRFPIGNGAFLPLCPSIPPH